jgi:hypothetical protein
MHIRDVVITIYTNGCSDRTVHKGSKTRSKNPFAGKAEYRPVRKNAITSEPPHFHIQIPRAAVVKGLFLYRIPKSVVEIISAGCFLNQTYQVTSTTKKPRFWSFVLLCAVSTKRFIYLIIRRCGKPLIFELLLLKMFVTCKIIVFGFHHFL